MPAVGSSKPPIIRSVVVLPQPDGPSSAKKLPRGIARVRSSTAATSAEALRHRAARCRSSRLGRGDGLAHSRRVHDMHSSDPDEPYHKGRPRTALRTNGRRNRSGHAPPPAGPGRTVGAADDDDRPLGEVDAACTGSSHERALQRRSPRSRRRWSARRARRATVDQRLGWPPLRDDSVRDRDPRRLRPGDGLGEHGSPRACTGARGSCSSPPTTRLVVGEHRHEAPPISCATASASLERGLRARRCRRSRRRSSVLISGTSRRRTRRTSAGSATSRLRLKNSGCPCARQISIRIDAEHHEADADDERRRRRRATSRRTREFVGLARSKHDLTKIAQQHQPAEDRSDAEEDEVLRARRRARWR